MESCILMCKLACRNEKLINCMQRKLTKYLYNEYGHCPERFWLRMNDEILEMDEKAELDPQIQYFRAQNELLQHYALQLLQTKQGCDFEQQKIFETDIISATADFVETNHILDKKAVYEVRNAKFLKSHHIWDLAYIAYVAQQAGEKIAKYYLVHVNADYSYNGGEIEAAQLLEIVDITMKVKQRVYRIAKEIDTALKFAKGSMPATALDLHTCRKKDCAFIRRHHPTLPDNSVYELKGINKITLQRLLSEGVINILDVPEKYIHSDLQRLQIEMIRGEKPIIDNQRLVAWLGSLRYPLYFLDYEAIMATVPVYERTQPFQHVVFQYSLHILETPDAELQHYEFLAEGKHLPIPELLKNLSQQLKADEGSVLVWHDSFEKARNREMAALCPEYRAFLEDINARIVDMEKVFAIDGGIFLHPEFKGRSSIKKILPVLVPDAALHSDLDISDGMEAAIGWFHYLTTDADSVDLPSLRRQLLAYCKLDTLALVLILKELKEM